MQLRFFKVKTLLNNAFNSFWIHSYISSACVGLLQKKKKKKYSMLYTLYDTYSHVHLP